MINTVKGFGIVNKAKGDVSLELSCFFVDLVDVGSLISCSSAFLKSSLNVWKFTVHILLKPGLENLSVTLLVFEMSAKNVQTTSQLHSGSSAFYKSNFNIWKFLVVF